MSKILINNPGDGEWVMEHCFGTFYPLNDHVIANHSDDGRIKGGFVFCSFMGAAAQIHMAGVGPGWCTRDLLWMAFHYAFVQLGLRKLVGLVASNNSVALEQDLRGGWTLEAIVKDVYVDGADMLVLTMTKAECRWLRIKPSGYRPGISHYSSEKEAV
jgi:hypothetical protein